MEQIWKQLLYVLCGLVICKVCDGLPINLDSTVAGVYTQVYTGLAALLLTVSSVVFLIGCLCCHKNYGFKTFRNSHVVASTSTLDDGHVNPVANREFIIFTPLAPPIQNDNVFLANQQIINRSTQDYVIGDVDVRSWFSKTDQDFSRSKLKYIKEIGKGWFGRVVEGTAQGIENDNKWIPVVVRILEATASSRERIFFLHEASIYRCGTHQNILKLHGRCLDTIPLLLLQEFCSQGDLKKYLRDNKASNPEKLLSTEYPLVWCCQLTSALKHLHQHKLTHPDIAARNCQLTSNLNLKLGDYGLATSQYPEDYYLGSPGVSVRWCAPESVSCTSTTIELSNITFEANIWSLAVTMWEIYECGEQPYAELNDDEVISQVLTAQRMKLYRPKNLVLCTDYMFRLMQLCWTNKESRPGITQIDLMLTELLQVYKNTMTTKQENDFSIKDFDTRWESFKPNNIIKTDNNANDSSDIDLESVNIIDTKSLSPSLNNLHGSLDNLLLDNSEYQMESWLENVSTKTDDESYIKGLSDAIKHLDNVLASENNTNVDADFSSILNDHTKLEFQLGPLKVDNQNAESLNQNDSLNDSLGFAQRTSSGSETEEENWKKKIERGAYTEKVRQKSRSVADLMILTHIEPSESESETPLPSLDYKPTAKNLRFSYKQNFENVSLAFGSEGNLLNVADTFEEELKKMREERRDSLLFVPENNSQIMKEDVEVLDFITDSNTFLADSATNAVLQKLDNSSNIQPSSQVFNVFNVTIDNYSPVRLKPSKLDEIINFKEDEQILPRRDNQEVKVPKLSDIIRGNLELINYLPKTELFTYIERASSENDSSDMMYDSGVEGDKMESTESLGEGVDNFDFEETVYGKEHQNKNEDVKSEIKHFDVPKLIDLIQDNETLMDYVIAKYKAKSLGKINDSFDRCDVSSNLEENVVEDAAILAPSTDEDINSCSESTVNFDLSQNQEQVMPNILTHSSVFPNKSLEPESSLEKYFSLSLFNVENKNADNNPTNLYSLETWDQFLGTTLDTQSESHDLEFNSFSSEPQSLLFIDNQILQNENNMENLDESDSESVTAFVDNGKTSVEQNTQTNEEKSLNAGWFLHPQINSDEIPGPINANFESYVGFNVDDEIVTAIRTELLNKLPHAQKPSSSTVQDDEDDDEWDDITKNEVFLKYNIYNILLSPIPEESSFEESSCCTTPRQLYGDDQNSDWSDQCDNEALVQEVLECQIVQSEQLHRHTPSQESCCSNDTLFNLEELAYAVNETERESDKIFKAVETPNPSSQQNVDAVVSRRLSSESEDTDKNLITKDIVLDVTSSSDNVIKPTNRNIITQFLDNERKNYSDLNEKPQPFMYKQLAPLPSPEDNPWKQLPASLLSYDKVIFENILLPAEPSTNEVSDLQVSDFQIDENIKNKEVCQVELDNVNENKDASWEQDMIPSYENHLILDDYHNEADYNSIVHLENTKNSTAATNIQSLDILENLNDQNKLSSETLFEESSCLIGNTPNAESDNVDALTDIRFSGPIESHYMTTSFSESNELNDDQEWDSGSDTRSCSSAEFIWKEGENEESVKVLSPIPRDLLDAQPPLSLQEETSCESSSGTDDEVESHEFVPSAWDKYATPTKSALRSPEKKEDSEKKMAKAVWFKKQKYHCVYEYPREPESPIINRFDLWQPQTEYISYCDWEMDGTEAYTLPENVEETNITELHHRPKQKPNLNIYQLSTETDFSTSDSVDDEFFISSSAKPFEITNGVNSQFFPGLWDFNAIENATPDSGVEDAASSAMVEDNSTSSNCCVRSLKQLALEASQSHKKANLKKSDILGGLRHTRNKLKLDLPPSPSAITSNKIFSIEPVMDPLINVEKPTFTTFGKSRFLVQHVDTPPDDKSTNKNVSFEALPYKPLQTQIVKGDYDFNKSKRPVEFVRGEASLLDSADEDSGIESSIMEKKTSNAG